MLDSTEIPVLDKGWVRYIDHMGTDYTSANAARQSFDHDPNKRVLKDKHLNRHLIGSDPMHGVPFEHIQLQLQVKLPKAIYIQWMKHRVQAQTEQPFDVFEFSKVAPVSSLSARYQEFNGDFYVPAEELMTRQSSHNKQGDGEELIQYPSRVRTNIKVALDSITDEYVEALSEGLTRDRARFLLTDAHYTTITVTANVRAWLDFCRQRGDSHAQYEIRAYSKVVESIIEQLWPNIYAGWVWFVRDSVRLSVGHQKALSAWILAEDKPFLTLDELLSVRRHYGMGAREARNLWGFMARMGLVTP